MAEYTKEPLEVHQGQDYCHIYGGEYDNSENPLAIIPSGLGNANRLAACYNGCVGINPDAVPLLLDAAKEFWQAFQDRKNLAPAMSMLRVVTDMAEKGKS